MSCEITGETSAHHCLYFPRSDEAMRIGDRIAIMQNGEVVQVGTPDEILNNPAMIMSARSPWRGY